MRQPLVRILGVDGSGKTTICNRLEALDSQVITFGSTPSYAYRWLETYGIGKADKVTLDQVDIRQHVFSKMNEHEAYTHNSICVERPVVAVRGRADTWISANALRKKAMPKDMNTLFPKDLRPDLLVVLQASHKTIESRIDARGEVKRGANSMAYHDRTQHMYSDLATIAKRYIPVLEYTTDNTISPDQIATEILSAINTLRPARRPQIAGRPYLKKLQFETMDESVRSDFLLARKMAMEHAYPIDKITKAGCVIASGEERFTGSNIKRWSWNNTTCCERMALDRAFAAGTTSIDRLTLFVTSIGGPITGIIAPCGPCRELLKEAVYHLGQKDMPIFMAGPSLGTAVETTLSALLPMSGTLTPSERWILDD